MVRHELKDGKWYLVKDNNSIWGMGKYFKECNAISFGPYDYFNVVNMIELCLEWVEIDPELVFELFSKKIPIMSDDPQRDKEAFGS